MTPKNQSRLYVLPIRDGADCHVEAILNDTERHRSARYLRVADRNAFVTARTALRYIVSGAVGCAPGQVKFTHTSWGKPVLADAFANNKIHFNVSHSDRLCVVAISRSGPVGVDIEKCRSVPERMKIATNLFGTGVARQMSSLPTERQNDVFLRLWTAAEASLKAQGSGLGATPHRMPLSLSTEGDVTLDAKPNEDAARWSLSTIRLPGYVGSFVETAYPHNQPAQLSVEHISLSQLSVAFGTKTR